MLRLNVILISLVVASALGVVAAQHQSRKLFADMEHEQARMRALEDRWNQLQLEQGTWAGRGRVEKMARERLRMDKVMPEQVVSLENESEAAR